MLEISPALQGYFSLRIYYPEDKGSTIKTKAEKRKWWNKINAEQQNDFIDKKVEDKKLKRKKRHK